MKRLWNISPALLMMMSFIPLNNACANYYNPRITFWGLTGSSDQIRGDLLFPLLGNSDNSFYTDIQANYSTSDNYYAGIGGGFRKLHHDNSIYGAYLFIDRNKTQLHSTFNVLSPGVEAFFTNWDFRINGYYPLNRHGKTISFFPSQQDQGCGDCGMNCADTQFIVFRGHQEFENQFSIYEQAGPGAEAEAGYTFHQLNNTQFHAGIYYFNFNKPNNTWNFHNTADIRGAEVRVEVPVDRRWAATLQSSYDNYQHGALLIGLRLDLFASKQMEQNDIRSHMVDPIPRHLGSFKKGSGIPAVKTEKNNGLLLERDNIYFFTSQGGSVFVNATTSGTFENPLNKDQFTQSVVNQIGNNANLYFNSGNYIIMGTGTAPNATINLPGGDSIYGRSLNFKSSAAGDERPILLGGLNLLQGNNTLDSIQLINSNTSTGSTDNNVIALNIQNAANVFLCNDYINATAITNGDLLTGNSNLAIGINANNSQVIIKNSTINSYATANNVAFSTSSNTAIGIGSSATDFSNNTFTIQNSQINSSVSVNEVDSGRNNSVGIGISGNINAVGNTFNLTNTTVSSTAMVANNNAIGINEALGIGIDEFGNSFSNNIFNLTNSRINSTAAVSGDNSGFENVAIGIGNNSSFVFDNNTFNLAGSTVSANAVVGGNNTSTTNGNEAIGIGGFSDISFTNNTFNLTNNSSVNAVGSVEGDNNFFNITIGIGDLLGSNFTNNTFNLTNAAVNAEAPVNSNNSISNIAIGMGVGPFTSGFTGNTFNVFNSVINSTASVAGNNSGSNQAFGVTFSTGGNTANINQSIINTLAEVSGTNSGSNSATGLEATGAGDAILISNSIVNTTANASGGANTATGQVGNVTSVNTTYNTIP